MVNNMWIIYVLMSILIILILISFIYSSVIYVASGNADSSLKKLDDVLKKKFNMVCKLIDISLDYFKKDTDVYEDMTYLRKVNYNNLNEYGKFKLSSIVDAVIFDIKFVASKNEKLANLDKYKMLLRNEKRFNDELMNYRKSYNDCVKRYNNLISTPLGKVIAVMFGFKLKEYYGILDGERNNIKLNL